MCPTLLYEQELIELIPRAHTHSRLGAKALYKMIATAVMKYKQHSLTNQARVVVVMDAPRGVSMTVAGKDHHTSIQ